MLFGIIKILFAISAVIFSFLLILHKSYTKKVKDNMKISNYVALIAFSLSIYILCGIIAVIMLQGLKFKFIMFIIALCPFIIGRFATFQKIKLYSIIQILIMLSGVAVIYLK